MTAEPDLIFEHQDPDGDRLAVIDSGTHGVIVRAETAEVVADGVILVAVDGRALVELTRVLNNRIPVGGWGL